MKPIARFLHQEIGAAVIHARRADPHRQLRRLLCSLWFGRSRSQVYQRQHLESLQSTVDIQAQPLGPKPKGKTNSRNAPQFDLRTELYRLTGINWTQINGMDVLTAQTDVQPTAGA
jgi:hypothetical protein